MPNKYDAISINNRLAQVIYIDDNMYILIKYLDNKKLNSISLNDYKFKKNKIRWYPIIVYDCIKKK